MLETQNVSVEFSGGIDTKTDEKLVLPGKLTLLENGIFTHQTIGKRNGYLALPKTILGSTDLISNSKSISFFKDELIQFANNKVYSYSSANSAWVDKGAAFSAQVGNKSITRNASQLANADVAYSNGVYLYAWQDVTRGGVRCTVVEGSTGTQFQSDVQVSSTGKIPKCIVIGAYLFVIYSEGSNIKARRIDPLSPLTLGNVVTIGSDFYSTQAHFDCDVSGLKAVIAYRSGSTIKLKYFTQDGVVGTTTIGLPNTITINKEPTNALQVAVAPSTLDVYVFWHNSSDGLVYQVLYADFTTKHAQTTISATTAPIVRRVTAVSLGSSTFQVFYEVNGSDATKHFIKTTTVDDAGTVGTLTTIKRGVGIAAKCFLVGSSVYLPVAYDSTLQATYFLISSTGVEVSKMLSDRGGGLPYQGAITTSVVSSVVNLSTTEIILPTLRKNKFVSDGITTFTTTGVTETSLDFGNTAPSISKELGGNLHLLGGFLSMYDGLGVVEHGFHLFPEGVTALAATSGGSVADGTYGYNVLYEWTDNQGNLHRSSPSITLSATVSGGSGSGKVTLTIPTLRLTQKTLPRSEVVIGVYRTLASGTVAHRVGSVTNDPTADTVSFQDTSIDSAISGSEILYTSGGVLENIAAPAPAMMDIYKNRIVLIPAEDKLSLWYSKVKVQAEGVQFNDSLYFNVDPLGGDLIAPKMMDDKIILFKRSNIFAVAGDGPNDLGQNNDFTVPTLVTSDVGCIEPRSIVLTPAGIMFQSEKGIYLIDRTLTVKYVGAEVESYSSQAITGSTLIEDKNQVRFLTDDGLTLVFDYFYNQWSTFTNHEGLSACIWNRAYTYLRAENEVYVEEEDYFLDSNSEIRLRMATAWIKMAGLQGFQRVRRASILGNYKSSHILRMKVGYDYESTYPDTILFPANQVLDQNYYGEDTYFGSSTVYGGVTDNIYQFQAHLRRQKCEAIRFLFEDVTAGTPGEGYNLSNLTLDVGVKKGQMKLRAAKSL